MPAHMKATAPASPEGMQRHESSIVDELLDLLCIVKEPFRAWGANDILGACVRMIVMSVFGCGFFLSARRRV